MSNITVNKSFVALLDILGFKALRNKLGTKVLAEKYNEFDKKILEYARANNVDYTTCKSVENVFSCKKYIFSDTVLFYRTSDAFEDFISIIVTVQTALYYSTIMQMPLRGAIGYGDISINENIFVGSAIENAKQYYEIQEWAGCMLTPECNNLVEEKKYLDLFVKRCNEYIKKNPTNTLKSARSNEVKSILIKYNIPIKRNFEDNNFINGLAINWPIKTTESEFDVRKAFLEPLSESDREKQENTRNFWNYIKKERIRQQE